MNKVNENILSCKHGQCRLWRIVEPPMLIKQRDQFSQSYPGGFSFRQGINM